jgi:hypothetical protein
LISVWLSLPLKQEGIPLHHLGCVMRTEIVRPMRTAHNRRLLPEQG